MKIVLNRSYGAFSLSPAAICRYFELLQIPVYFYLQVKYKNRDRYDEWRLVSTDELSAEQSYLKTNTNYGISFREIPDNFQHINVAAIDRTSDALVQTVEELGSKSYGKYSYLEIFDIPDIPREDYYIDDYDGMETVHEKHRTWPSNEYRRR